MTAYHVPKLPKIYIYISALLKEIARGKLVIYYSDDKVEISSRTKQGKAAINKVHQGLQELAAILF